MTSRPAEARPGPRPRLLQPAALYGLALTLILLASLFYAVWRDHEEKIAGAERRVAAMALLSDRLLSLELRNLERALQGIALDYAALERLPGDTSRQRNDMVAGVASRHAELASLVVLDRAGRALTAGTGDPDAVRWARAPSNRVHAGGFVVGTPARAVGSNDWLVPLAVATGDHGWVVARLRISALWHVIDGQDVGRGGVVNIFHRDGTMLARSRDSSRSVGKDFSRSELMRELRIHPTGAADLVSPVDGVRRLLGFRRLADYPLVVVVGLARSEVLGTWYGFALASALVCVLYGLGWALLLHTLAKAARHQGGLLAQLRKTTDNLMEAQEIGGLGSWLLYPDTGEVEFSPQAALIYGWQPGDPPINLASGLGSTHPADRARLDQAFARHLATRSFERTQFRIVRPDGSVRTLVARGRFGEARGQTVMMGTIQDITDLAEAHAALEETEAQYRLLFDCNPLPFWVFHRDSFRILEANAAAVAQYGYTREEFQQMSLQDIRPREDAELALAAARQPDPEGRRGRVWRHLKKDGTVIMVAVHSSDITFHGEPARLVLALDVTERQQEQRRLERSESRFQLVARATSDAVFDWNIETGEIWRSSSFETLFNYQPADVAATIDAWWQRVHPDDLAGVQRSLREVFDSQASEWQAQYRFRRGDGSYAHVLDRGLLERTAEGKPSRMVGGMVDVTQRHKDEAQLRLLRRAIESTENGIAISDARSADMPLVYVNPAFERITGYPASEVLGRNCRFLQGDDSLQAGAEVIRRAIANREEAQVLLRNYRRNGELFYNQFSLSPVREEGATIAGGALIGGPVTHFVGILEDVTLRHRHEGELAFQASHDELTGLLNRTALLATLEHLLAARTDAPVTLLYIDLNNFKLINDSMGHEVGDHVLTSVAARLREQVGASDRVGRVGGNEFVVLLAGSDARSQQAQADALLANLARPVVALETMHYLSLNAGLARYPEHGTTPETLFRNAGLATHEAKRRGPNQRAEFAPAFERAVSERQQLVSRLHEAIARQEFEVHFQTLFCTTPLRPIGLEALVRWHHPERGLVPPSEFIAVCEDSGLIVPLGRWVLREACRHHRLLAAAGWPALTIAVNVSALQFLSGELQADIPRLLREFGVPAGVLELELTESLVMENPEPVIEVMRQLHEYGVLLSIDDFGTGYSSMSYLHRLPVDKLKIDRSFVSEVDSLPHNAAICESILALARSFGLKVIAEGVETQAQFDWLRAHGCDEAQGYLLARPQPFSDLLASLGPPPQ